MAIYLDCNASTPLEPGVLKVVTHYLANEVGNAGSRTHEFGARAKAAVDEAREQVAAAVCARPEEVVFTSGATEANNLALLGLVAHGEARGKRHVVSTQIEHKAVLEPLRSLEARGFTVTLVRPTRAGWVDPVEVERALTPQTLLVSIMHVNNETGVVQPLTEIASRLADHPAYLHVDAAQGLGKDVDALRNRRLDLISISGHKIHAPQGIGALVARRRRFERPPLAALQYGGGQERGLRAGTLPVALIAGLGEATKLAVKHHAKRREACLEIRRNALRALAALDPHINGDPERCLPHVLNLSIPGLDSEAVMVALKGLVAISNGSACTSSSYQPSHVLQAMGIPEEQIQGAIRLSWCHLTEPPDWEKVVATLKRLRP